MTDNILVSGYLKAFKNGVLVYEHSNAIDGTLYTALRNKLLNRDSAGRGAGIDGITWGYKDTTSGTFTDGTYAGTFAAGSNGNCVFSTPTTQQVKMVGTFTFAVTKLINYFELGQGYGTAGAGVTQLITTRYAYQDSLYTSKNSISFSTSEQLVVDWTLQIGA